MNTEKDKAAKRRKHTRYAKLPPAKQISVSIHDKTKQINKTRPMLCISIALLVPTQNHRIAVTEKTVFLRQCMPVDGTDMLHTRQCAHQHQQR